MVLRILGLRILSWRCSWSIDYIRVTVYREGREKQDRKLSWLHDA